MHACPLDTIPPQVAQPVQLPPRSIVRLIEPVYTRSEDFALVHCPRTRAVGLTLRSNLYQLGLEQSAEYMRELLESATQTGSTLATSPGMPLLESMVSFSEISYPKTRRSSFNSFSFSEGTDVPKPKLMELCTVLAASGHELQERSPQAVRIVFISDTHGRHEHLQLPGGDILVHGGDFVEAYPTNTAAKISNKLPPPLEQLEKFFSWLQKQAKSFKHVVLIPGNHDTLLDPMVSVSPAFQADKAITKIMNNVNQWTVTPKMHQRAIDMMLPQKLGGSLPNNCIYLDGVRRQYAVVPTGVDGKVLRFFGSPICRSRDPANKAKRNSMGFCWLNRLEKKRDIVGYIC